MASPLLWLETETPSCHTSSFEQHGQEWNDCRIDGCRYGMVDSNNELLKKKWMIKTNDELFHGQYRCKVCTGGHCHGRIEGRETQKSSYYPWKMVQSFARFWAQQTVSKQQLQRMNFHDVATVEDCDGGDLCCTKIEENHLVITQCRALCWRCNCCCEPC